MKIFVSIIEKSLGKFIKISQDNLRKLEILGVLVALRSLARVTPEKKKMCLKNSLRRFKTKNNKRQSRI